MTITQLAAFDAAERVRLHAAAVEAVRWQIARVAKRKGRTDFLTAHLARLEQQR